MKLETQGPHNGSESVVLLHGMARSIDPISSTLWLKGPNDGKVTVERTKMDGMTDHVVIPVAHPFIMAHPLATRQTIAFLR